MKALIKLFLAAFVLCMISCKPSPQKAQKYYTDISKPIESVLIREDELIKVINANMKKDSAKSILDKKAADKTEISISVKALDMAFSNFQLQIATSLNQIKSIGRFDDKSTLHDAALEMLNEYKAVTEKEYPALIEIVKIPDIQYSNGDDSRFLDLTDSIDNKLQRKITAYIQQVKLFSQEYNFQLDNDSLK